MLLVIILFVGGIIRVVDLPQSPPGLNQDEAANAWNAWSILKTGKDQTGERWPIFATRCHGGYSSALHLYWMMPFQAVGGLNVWTTRLPFAVAGIITLGLICYVGNRMFGPPVGLMAAGLMALNPWHIQQSRWGHEAALCPLLVTASLAAMLWARLPIADTEEPPRPWRSILAGAMLGLSCYGYQAMRAFLPGFMVLAVALTFPAWWRWGKTKTGAIAIGGFVLAAAIVFGPLAYEHIAEPQRIGRQLTETVWNPGDPLYRKALAAAGRYPVHFGAQFLFIRADLVGSDWPAVTIESPGLAGTFAWYTLPLFVAGLVTLARSFRTSRAARVLLAAIVAYPLGDCLAVGVLGHLMRSLPGLPGMILLAALGAASLVRWLQMRHVQVARLALGGLAIAVVGLSGHFLWEMFVDYPRRPFVQHYYQQDFREACEWLRPRFKGVDAVFCTTNGLNMPYAISLVMLNYDPAQWFRDEQDVDTSGRWDIHKRYGKMRFIYEKAADEEFSQYVRQPGKHVVLILRPGSPLPIRPVKQITRPDGAVVMDIFEFNT